MQKDSPKAAPPRATRATAKAASPQHEPAPLNRQPTPLKPRLAPAASSRPASAPSATPAGAAGRNVKARAGGPKSKGDRQGVAEAGEAKARPRTRLRQPDESRAQMLERLSNPLISLHEASVLLQVCAATVRRLSNEGELPHKRTEGGQRRFHLRDVLRLSDERERRRAASGRVSARSLASPPARPSASLAPAALHSNTNSGRSLREREQERLEEARVEQARAREGRERLAAMHARAQAAQLAAQKQPAQTSAAPGQAARSTNPLRLGLARALAPRAGAGAGADAKPKTHEGDE